MVASSNNYFECLQTLETNENNQAVWESSDDFYFIEQTLPKRARSYPDFTVELTKEEAFSKGVYENMTSPK